MIIIIVIVIAVIAILAAVLIPTFSGVVTKAQKSAAFQEAKNAWTEYLADHDYTEGEPEKNLIIVVNEDYYVEVVNGEIETEAQEIPEGGFESLVDDADAVTDGVQALFGTKVYKTKTA